MNGSSTESEVETAATFRRTCLKGGVFVVEVIEAKPRGWSTNGVFPRLECIMASVVRELASFERAVKASNEYPGATPAAYACLKRLRRLYKKSPRVFTTRVLKAINDQKRLLRRPVDLVECPTCHGGGTQRWMASYKHTCNRCGGWKRVEKTEEAMRENKWTWGG
jgi:hypothetical protein